MDKKTFIQQTMIRSLPPLEKIDAGITYAENLWAALSQRGYGGAEKRGPNKMQNHYQQLSGQQKKWFDQFWKAYNHKHGKQDTAARWLQINPDQSTAQHIVSAAKQAAKQTLPQGGVRKHPQGWLTERRWEDYEVVKQSAKQSSARAELLLLQSKLSGIANLKANQLTPELKQQKQQLEQQIEELSREQ
jgi:hypothetical protein